MKLTRSALFAVAALLLVQAAFANEKKPLLAPKASPVVAAPVQTYVPKLSYCFVPKLAKPIIDAQCPPGYTLVKAENRCKKDAGYECADGGVLTVDSFGAAVCKYCKPFHKLGADGKCIMACKPGFASTLISGVKYCVQSCKEGFYSNGNECVSTKKQYTPKECSDKLCLPKFKLYFTQPASASSGRKLSNATPAPAKASPSCVCTLTDPRDVYEQPCHDPYLKAATKVTKYEDAVCPNHEMPVLGLCILPCPSSCYETLKGECEYPCPPGSVPCKTLLFGKVCVKGTLSTYSKGKDVCEEIKKTTFKLDKSLMCPVASPAPVPSPIWKPVPAPAPHAKKDVKKIVQKVKDAVTSKLSTSKLG